MILADPAMPLTMLLQLLGTIALLVWQVGSAGLVGFAVLTLLLLISTRVVRRMNQQEQQLKRQQDERNGILAEYIKKLRLVRQNGLGAFFTRAAGHKRQQELGCGRVLRLDAINESLMLSTPLLVTLATFTTYLVSGRELTLPQVFTTIALFTVLRIPMMRLPYLIRTLINFNTGFNRLCEFLNSPEQHRSTDPSLPVGGLRLDNVTALHQQKPVLEDQSAHRAGELVGITGATGAGRAACCTSSPVSTTASRAASVATRVAHLGHKPWLMNDTIRNNILFGQPWHGERYRWVLGACALGADLTPAQPRRPDPGRRARHPPLRRPATAGRAGPRPYAQADILLLDNPLSALDPIVSAQVLEQGSPSPGPTRLLVSHDPDVLAHCDRVIRIEQGRLVELDAHQLADLIQHPRPTRRCRLRRRSSSARRRWWRARWTGGCSASCGSAWPPPAPSCSPCCSLWARRAAHRLDLWLGGKAGDRGERAARHLCAAGAGSHLHHGGAGQLQTRPQAGLDPARRHAGAHQPRPHGLLRQGAAGAHPQPLRSGSGEAQEILLSMLMGLFGMLVSVALQVVVIGVNMPLLLLIAPW